MLRQWCAWTVEHHDSYDRHDTDELHQPVPLWVRAVDDDGLDMYAYVLCLYRFVCQVPGANATR